MRHQPTLFPDLPAKADPLSPPWEEVQPHPAARRDTSSLLPLSGYARIVLMFSGGKDSAAMVLHVLARMAAEGVPRGRLELWHQLVDGSPEDPTFMDWPVTHAYCEAFAHALDLPLLFQWRAGGFRREMDRADQPTAPVTFTDAQGQRSAPVGGAGPAGTRGRFPMPSGDIQNRWCSAALKIDVAARALANDPRPEFRTGPILVLTGERREEGGKSGGRAKYATTEAHRTSTKTRRVDHHRPILGWPEGRVWATLRDHGIVPHPCYFAGYGRASCSMCIFGGPDEWATARVIMPDTFGQVRDRERSSGFTIHRKLNVDALADDGALLCDPATVEHHRRLLLSRSYDATIWCRPDEWTLPGGAFRHGGGPT